MFKKLRNKMLLFNMGTTFLVILAAFTAVYFATYSNIERENKRRLQALSEMPLVRDHPLPGGGDGRPAVPERFGADYRVSFALLVKDGVIEGINSHLDFEEQAYKEAFKKTGGKATGELSLGGRKWAYLVSEILFYGENRYERIVFLDITSGAATLRQLLFTLCCVGFAVLLVLLWVSYYFVVRAVRPIEVSYNKQKQFVADASHEFKTPLAIISANIDAIEASAAESVESQKEWFGYIRAELGRATKLVDNLLCLAKAESANIEAGAPFNLSRASETACASMEAALYDRGITLEAKIEENIIIAADGEGTTRILYILLDNAAKYTPQGGRILFSLGLEQQWAVVRISNSGQGIAVEEFPKIFDRFYRPDASRSQETGGFGLGLSIAKAAVERSGGKISIESGEGLTTFTVRLKSI